MPVTTFMPDCTLMPRSVPTAIVSLLSSSLGFVVAPIITHAYWHSRALAQRRAKLHIPFFRCI